MPVLQRARDAKHRAFLFGKDVAAVRTSALYRWQERRTVRRAADSMVLPDLPHRPGSIWAVAMVRDEEDVIERSVRALVRGGVNGILVADNGSKDGTRAILEDLGAELPVFVGDDNWSAYEQSAKMTHLASVAAGAGAEWLIPFDADELWMGKGGTIDAVLRRSPAPIITAELVNAFPDPRDEVKWRLDPVPHSDPKVAFRHFPRAVIEMGNHQVHRPGRTGTGLGIIHLPWRSFEQFRRKVRQGSAAIDESSAPSDKGWHWRRLDELDEQQLRSAWADILHGRPVPANAWQPGPVTVPFALGQSLSWADVELARQRSLYL